LNERAYVHLCNCFIFGAMCLISIALEIEKIVSFGLKLIDYNWYVVQYSSLLLLVYIGQGAMAQWLEA